MAFENTEHNGIKERQWQTIVALAWPFQPLEIRWEDSCRHAKTRRLPLRPCSLTASEAAVMADAGSVEERRYTLYALSSESRNSRENAPARIADAKN